MENKKTLEIKGTPLFTVLKEYGVSDTATGENAAWGETTPEKVVADWMGSTLSQPEAGSAAWSRQ